MSAKFEARAFRPANAQTDGRSTHISIAGPFAELVHISCLFHRIDVHSHIKDEREDVDWCAVGSTKGVSV